MKQILAASVAAMAVSGPLCAQAQPPIPECSDVKTTASGLEYCVLEAGAEGPHPAAHDEVEVHYTGWLTDGTVFDSSRRRGRPAKFRLDNVIAGWTEGLQLMTPGARFKFTVPPDLAYGDRDVGPIPPRSTLIFEVELLDFTPMPEPPPLPKWKPANPEAQKTTESGIKWEYLQRGEGAKAEPGVGMQMRYALFTSEGELQTCSEQTNETLKGSADTLPLPFMQEIAPLMKVGDRLRIEVPARLGHRDQALGGPKTDAVWELELVKVQEVPEFAMPATEDLEKTASGLQYEVIREGEGKRPGPTARVRAHYAGWLTDGTLFDSSHQRCEPLELGLDRVIPGWTEGLQLMREGGLYKFVIPGELAYGPRGSPPRIGPNATLVFLVELIEIL